MKIRRSLTVGLVGLALSASPAWAATVTLALDPNQSVIPRGSAFPLKSGVTMYLAPATGFVFTATALNDAGAPAVPPAGDVNYATVDLVARTADGEAVLATAPVVSAAPVVFPIQYIQQNTTYYARINPSPSAGVAAVAPSAEFTAAAFLNYTANVSRTGRNVRFFGSFVKPATVNPSSALRVLIQRRSGAKWKTLRTLAPDAKRKWSTTVPVGAIPVAFRVRFVPIGAAKRYVTVNVSSYCVAKTSALARKTCNSVKLGPEG